MTSLHHAIFLALGPYFEWLRMRPSDWSKAGTCAVSLLIAYHLYKRPLLLIVTGTLVGGVTLNPIVLGAVFGSGFILKTFSEVKNYKRKIEMCKFADTSYEKVFMDAHMPKE